MTPKTKNGFFSRLDKILVKFNSFLTTISTND